MSRQIVIDTDIICAAGVVHVGDTRPAVCGRFLIATREHGHFVVVTDAILDEWRQKRSRFSSTWLTSMFARKQVRRLSVHPIDLQRAMTNAGMTSTEKTECNKDMHLVSAAVATDRRIASLDEAARELFRRVAKLPDGNAIGSIHWVNPEKAVESVVAWLEAGAPDDRTRLLGASQ